MMTMRNRADTQPVMAYRIILRTIRPQTEKVEKFGIYMARAVLGERLAEGGVLASVFVVVGPGPSSVEL